MVVVGRGGLDGCLRALGQISELDHVASVHQLLVSLLDLVLDVVLLGTLGVADTEDLIEVVMGIMLYRQKVHRIFGKGGIDPHPFLLQVHVNGLLGDTLLGVLLEALCLSSRRKFACGTVGA
jgi:hypothetical protein